MEPLRIELLYFQDCPSWQTTKRKLEDLLPQLGQTAKIAEILVETQEMAEAYHFVGSPTIRVDGVDLFPIDQTQYALGCRVYPTPHGLKGSPTEEMLRERLRLVLSSQ
jgi:hypothetical protein